MAKAPQSNLPPQAQPWGRYIEGQLAKLSLDAGIVGQDSNNTLAQLNSSIQLLSRQQSVLASQQAYLETFKTTSVSNPSTASTGTVGTFVTLRTVSMNVVLTRPSDVLISTFASADGGVTSYWADYIPGVSGEVTFLARVYVDGNLFDGGNFGTSNNITTSYIDDQTVTYTSSIQTSEIFENMPIGTHTIYVEWKVYMDGTYPNGYSTIQDSYVSASVIG
jgi:hypothetical protein